MAEQDSGQERTEEPTPKRLQEARKKGQVARSRDLNATAVMIAGAAGLLLLGPWMLARLQAILTRSWSPSREQIRDPSHLFEVLRQVTLESLGLLTPLLGLLLLAALVTPMLLGGWVFSFEALQPKLSKLDPVKGLARILSVRALMELLKALGKLLVVGGVAAVLFVSWSDDLLHLGLHSLESGLARAGQILFWSLLLLSSGMLLIAAIDVPFQIWQHTKQLKMTRQEVRDEFKQTEGKPEVKQKIRSVQQQLARSRMMDAVPDADVVITNPTHFAVALKYDQATMRAPLLVAKGSDLVAQRIRELARESQVTLVEAPPLARALWASTDIGREIPAPLYLAVAQVLGFVIQLRAAQRRGRRPPRPPRPDVPDDFLAAYGMHEGFEQ